MKKILLFGDSLTAYYPMETLPKKNVQYINKGIAGETLPEIKIRIKKDVIEENPDVVFVQGGANDYLSPCYQGAKKVANQLAKIALTMKEELPQAKVYVESLYPVYTKRLPGDIYSWAEGKSNAEIQAINSYVKEICEGKGPIYLDVYSCLADENGELSLEDTIDGVHLSQSGYEKVAKCIKGEITNGIL